MGILSKVASARSGLTVLKVLLLAVFVFATNPGVLERIHAIGLQTGLLVYAVIWLVSLAVTAFVAFCGGWVARIFWSVLWTAAAITGLSYWLITAKYMSLADMEMLLNAVAFASEATGAYGAQMLWAVAVCVVGLLAVNIPPYRVIRHDFPWRRTLLVLAPCVPVLMIVGILYTRGGEGSDGLPSQFDVPAFLVTLGAVHATAGPPPVRKTVEATPDTTHAPRIIVVLMDESIRGDELDIDGGKADSGLRTVGALATNFGVASSLANCSASSNVTFRYGASRKYYLTDIKVNPSMWAYAKHAGYQTWYIDAQRTGGALQNFMTPAEKAQIDHFVQIGPEVTPSEKDMQVARLLRGIIDAPDHVKKFVYVNKMGAHFPYEGKYPRDQSRFEPTLAQTYFGDKSTPKVAWPTSDAPAERARFFNSYLNAVSWNVGHFFDLLLPGLSLSDAVIVYTSDHGQNFHRDGSPGYVTHCTDGQAAMGEGRVPLVLLTNDAYWQPRFAADAKLNFGKASQFDVFPTLLKMMGYNLQQVADTVHVEQPLSAALDPRKQEFISTYFVRFGRSPVWNPIHRKSDGDRTK